MRERPIEPNCFETDREEQWHDVGYFDGYKDAIEKAWKWIENACSKYSLTVNELPILKQSYNKYMEE